jgi:heme exporter protein CcmD
METVDHLGFIVAAYVMAIIVVAGLILWITITYRGVKAQLAALEEQGISRRSGSKLS